MGHYRRKQYKKKSIDLYHNQEMIDTYISDLDILDEEEIFDDEPLSQLETTLMDEPEIVKQLRQEELEGKLPVLLYTYKDEEQNSTRIQEEPNKQNESKTTEPTFDYDDILKIARKSLKQIEKTSDKNIIFKEK